MRVAILLLTISVSFSAYGQIYKCVDTEGRTSFSNVPCVDPAGVSEKVRVQTSQVGALATPEQIDQHRHEIYNPPPRQQTKVTVIRDSTTGGPMDQMVNRRLDAREERVRQARSERSASGVTVVSDSGRESQLERAARLRHEERMYGINQDAPTESPIQQGLLPAEIDDREVRFRPNQDPLDRRLQQIKNKIDDPRPHDFSKHRCSSEKPRRGVVKVGREEIWPGMRKNDVRRSIGGPSSVNSVLVGHEQWVYRLTDGRSLFVYFEGQCVSSIQ